MKKLSIAQSLAIVVINVSLVSIYANYDYSTFTPAVDFGTTEDKIYFLLECICFIFVCGIISALNKGINYKKAWQIETILFSFRLIVEITAVTFGLVPLMKYLMAIMYGLSIIGLFVVIFIDGFKKRKERKCPKH